MQVQDMAYDSARSGSDRGGVSTINDGLADLGFRGTLTDATPLATQGGERRGLAAGNLWSFSRGDGPDAAGLRDPAWPCSALARTDGGPNSGNVTNSIAMNSDEFLAKGGRGDDDVAHTGGVSGESGYSPAPGEATSGMRGGKPPDVGSCDIPTLMKDALC
jgi:hypothetical protein